MWEIKQTKDFQKWYKTLDSDAQDAIYEHLEILKSEGPSLGRPRVDTVKASKYKNMKELIVQSKGRPFRILFIFDAHRKAVLLTGGNKEGKGDKHFYKTMILQADKLYEKYMKDMDYGKKGKIH